MKLLELLLPLLGVLLGAAITGTGTVWKARQARKKVLARALSDLLEVRHHLMAFDTVVQELRTHVNVPAEFLPQLRKVLEEISPIDSETHKRYNEAISILAELEPLLAFQLRSKDQAPELLKRISTLSSQSDLSEAMIAQLDATLHKLIVPHLDESVVQLAAAHSWRTKRRVLNLFAQRKAPPPELALWFEHAKPPAKDAEA